jgi:hypothetical protein
VGDGPGGSSLQEVINNAVAPLRIKREFIEAEGENMDVEADSGNIEVVSVVQPAFQQLGEGREDDPLDDIRNLFREKMEGGSDYTLPKLDNKYNTVKGLREKTTRFRELQRGIHVKEEPRAGLFSAEDDRMLFNSNNFRLDKGRNVSCSFENLGMTCVVCPAGTHGVLEGKDDKPVVFAIADQNFSASLPAKDGKDCIRVLRVEDGSLREITGEFVSMMGKKKILAGSVVLLGSLTQLEKDGTAQYIEDWHRCRQWIKDDLGELMVLPLIPIPVAAITDRATIRSMLEFFAWFEDMPEAESKLLCETREHFEKLYMARIGDGPGWCDDRQSFKLPISLSGSGRSTYKSRKWGARPECMLAFNSETEKYWISHLADNLNKDLATNLSVDISFLRKGSDIRQLELRLSKSATVVVGASNANRTALALTERNVPVTNLARPGWKLTAVNVNELVVRLRDVGGGDILVLHGLDANLFVSVDEDMSSRPPFKGRDGKFHSHGRLEVVSGYHLEKILDNIALLVDGCCGRRIILVMPIPRFWIACCSQARSASAEETEADRRRLLRELGRFKRAVSNLISRKNMDGKVKIVSPLEAIGVKDDLHSIEQVMLDPVHLLPTCYGMVADEIMRLMESWRDNKRKALSPAGSNSKKARLPTHGAGGFKGGRRFNLF